VLSISSPAGASAVRYYAELAQDGYYTQRCEAPGVWHGSGVKALGLEGEASPEQIENILKGFSPDGESKLVQNAGAENRKLGVDLTFSASKSVSCVWGLLDEQERETISEASTSYPCSSNECLRKTGRNHWCDRREVSLR